MINSTTGKEEGNHDLETGGSLEASWVVSSGRLKYGAAIVRSHPRLQVRARVGLSRQPAWTLN